MIYKIGDVIAEAVVFPKPVILAHACSNRTWQTEFGKAISERWQKPESEYACWERVLGETQLVHVSGRIRVASMMVHEYFPNFPTKKKGESLPSTIDYDALRRCLRAVGNEAILKKSMVLMPKIGTGSGGGEWSRIRPIVEEELDNRNIIVMVISK